ncbi:MAG: RNA polymerase sigma factor [Sandaracinaceae bacterium]
MAERGRPLPALRLVGPEEPVSDEALVAALLDARARGERPDSGRAALEREFFDRYVPLVERTLRRILGREQHDELSDLIHEAFVEALASLPQLSEAAALPGWMRSVAANVAYRTIRRRRARRWLFFWEPAAIPEPPSIEANPEVRAAFVATYAALSRLGAEHRVCFALRHLEGLSLAEVAEARGVSLATVKRRLATAEARFTRIAEGDPVLREWLTEGGRWTTR